MKIRGIYDDLGEPDIGLSDQAYQVANRSGIRILRDKEPVVVAIDKGKVIGALFTSLVGDSFSFDVAVDELYRGQGIGRQLIDAGIAEYRNLKFDMPDVQMDVDVVNPMLQDVLRRRGLEIKRRVSDDRVIMGSWLTKAMDAHDYQYPERGHDYDPNWDYEMDSKSEGIWRRRVDDYIQQLTDDLIPQLRLFRGIKVSFIRNSGYLAKYVSGTVSFPVILLDIQELVRSCKRYGVSCEDQWRLSILHELGHAIQEAFDQDMDEEWAERFADIYYHSGVVLRLEG